MLSRIYIITINAVILSMIWEHTKREKYNRSSLMVRLTTSISCAFAARNENCMVNNIHFLAEQRRDYKRDRFYEIMLNKNDRLRNICARIDS